MRDEAYACSWFIVCPVPITIRITPQAPAMSRCPNLLDVFDVDFVHGRLLEDHGWVLRKESNVSAISRSFLSANVLRTGAEGGSTSATGNFVVQLNLEAASGVRCARSSARAGLKQGFARLGASGPRSPFAVDNAQGRVVPLPVANPAAQSEHANHKLVNSAQLLSSETRILARCGRRKRNRLATMSAEDTAIVLFCFGIHSYLARRLRSPGS